MYLDPGAWAMVVQVLIGFLVAIPVLASVYWKWLKLHFSKKEKAGEDEGSK